jgi:two-component system, NarL family, nitrate/nitrite response regulator NarL
MRRINVVIADRHPVVLQGLSKVLAAHGDFNIVASCIDGKSCIAAVRNLVPDIALLEPSLPGWSGLEILSLVNSESLSTRLVFFTAAAEDSELLASATAGGYSIISKEVAPEMLARSLRQVAEGRQLLPVPTSDQAISRDQSAATENALAVLTSRERQIMRLVSAGLSNKEIGRRLNITDGTIKVHLHHIFQKLEISNRTVLAALAVSQQDNPGILPANDTHRNRSD